MTKHKNFKLSVNESNGANVNPFAYGGLTANQMRPFIDENGTPCVIDVNGKKQEISANANATLPFQSWLDIDETVIKVTSDRLTAIADLINNGLTYDLGSIGVTTSQWEKESDMTPADVSMNGETSGDEDGLNFDQDQVIVPMFHKNFRIPMRSQMAAQQNGMALDTSSVTVATRKVAEASEDMAFNGVSKNIGGSTVYGYTNYPSRNTYTIPTAWDLVTDNQDIVDDVINMCDAARADGYYGPYTIYIPAEYEGVMDQTYKPASGSEITVEERLMKIRSVKDIRVADRLADNNVVLVQLTNDVVDLAMAQSIAAVDWSENGGFMQRYRVFAVWAMRLKDTYDNDCGVVHGSV